MKYKTAKVISHPRAGSHYLAQLLNINFFHLNDYLPLYAGHGIGHRAHLNSKNTAVFYICRDIDDTVKSMFKLRNRFGLVCDNLNTFANTPMSKMHNKKIKSTAIRNIAGKKTTITKVDTALSSIDLTPYKYIEDHQNIWVNMYKSNLYIVYYDDLIDFFDIVMLDIAKFLGSNITEFIQETSRVGWYDVNDEKKILT